MHLLDSREKPAGMAPWLVGTTGLGGESTPVWYGGLLPKPGDSVACSYDRLFPWDMAMSIACHFLPTMMGTETLLY